MQKYQKLAVAVVVIIGALVAVTIFADRGLLGLDKAADPMQAQAETVAQADGTGSDWGKQGGEAGNLQVDYATIEQIFANLNENQRKTYLDNPETFSQFIHQEAGNLSVLAAARANKVDQDKNTRFLMQRSADNIVRETYLSRLITGKVPADFPSEDQIREYYDKNKDSFFLDERVHVWQIFLRTDESMDNNQVAAVEQRLKNIRSDIANNKVDFADAAMQYSEHAASKASGGYMGLVKVADLKSSLSEKLLALQEGRLSDPIKSDSGYHLLKRGAIVPRQDVSFEQVRTQIHDLLIQQAQAQLRQAVYTQAGKTYPVEVSDETIEGWRTRLAQ